MSDTPRTDSLLAAILDLDGYVAHRNCPPQWVYYARELERELTAANDQIKRLEEFVEQLTNPKFTRDDLPKDALLQRIKRLEEAGDALYENSDPTRWDLPEANARKLKEQEAWRKAKEAKP